MAIISLENDCGNDRVRWIPASLVLDNDNGFGALVGATVFSEAEADKAMLPEGVDGLEWLELPTVPKLGGTT